MRTVIDYLICVLVSIGITWLINIDPFQRGPHWFGILITSVSLFCFLSAYRIKPS